MPSKIVALYQKMRRTTKIDLFQQVDFSFMYAGHNFVTSEASTSFDSLLST